jgi:hypothetical protein
LAQSECFRPTAEQKSLAGRASEELRISPADLDARLKALGSDIGRPWRKEQKLACFAAFPVLSFSLA